MRILNDVELTLIRSEMYANIAKTGNVTQEQVIQYRDFVLEIPEYCQKKSMIVRNILNALTWNISNYSNDIEVVSKNYRDLLQMVNDNIEPIDIEFFYNLYLVTCGKYNHAFIINEPLETRISLLEEFEAAEVPLDYINEHIDAKNMLLRCYLDSYEKYSHKVPSISTKLKELVLIRKGIDPHQFDLFN